ncbi:GIY-YIG nuclease family protein [Gordonia rubripertincta]|uniref:GIY-YIG nuclease family protein n=1 Tax=Gordonia rubripertincta TaxID=36822 RepID=UPI003CC826F3
MPANASRTALAMTDGIGRRRAGSRDESIEISCSHLLTAPPHSPDLVASEADTTGVYAWWGSEHIPWPADFPPTTDTVPLYVGLASSQTVGNRIVRNHLRSTRRSALRRSLTALLVDDLKLRSHVECLPAPGKFTLAPTGERALSEWMRKHLTVSWVATGTPVPLEAAVIAELLPPLNDAHATGSPYRKHLRELRASVCTDPDRHTRGRRT